MVTVVALIDGSVLFSANLEAFSFTHHSCLLLKKVENVQRCECQVCFEGVFYYFESTGRRKSFLFSCVCSKIQVQNSDVLQMRLVMFVFVFCNEA